MMVGQGVLKTKVGTYDGEFKENKMHGKGKFTYTDGTSYEGPFENGERVGRGTFLGKDGEKYLGEFKVRIPPATALLSWSTQQKRWPAFGARVAPLLLIIR